jgi:hypothetical protein
MADGSVHIEAETVAPESPQPSAPKRKIERARLKVRPIKRLHAKSEISFPYMDMDAAVSVARAMLDAGGVALTREQLAGVMNLSVGSGNFVTKVATARMFGLIANKQQGKYELTTLGFEIVDDAEKRHRKARADSFLTIPLYRRVYDEFRGKQLPPRPHGLEQAFVKFGVAAKQVGNARIVFERSARQAGFFGAGPERLIEPIIGNVPPAERRAAIEDEPAEEDTGRGSTGNQAIRSRTLHPFIEGLLDALPEPNTNWALEGRAKWLQAAAYNFDLMYKGADDQTVLIEIKKTERSKTTEQS